MKEKSYGGLMDGETHDSRLGSDRSLNTLSEVMTSLSRRSWKKTISLGRKPVAILFGGRGRGWQCYSVSKGVRRNPPTEAHCSYISTGQPPERWKTQRSLTWEPSNCNRLPRLPNAAPPAAAWLWRVLPGLLRHSSVPSFVLQLHVNKPFTVIWFQKQIMGKGRISFFSFHGHLMAHGHGF